MEKVKENKILLICVVSIVCLILMISFKIFIILNKNTIYKGVKIREIDVENLTKEQALNYIKSNIEDDKYMLLKYEDYIYNISVKQFKFNYDYDKAVQQAYAVGRKGSLFKKIRDIIHVRRYGKNINIDSSYDMDCVIKLVEEISKDINIDCKNAVLNLNNEKISISEEKIGRKVDKETLKKNIIDNMYILENIQIPVQVQNPEIAKKMLSRINGIIGEYTTSFKGSSVDRIKNIKIAAQSIDGKLILSNEIVSFNELTGPRTKENGYKEAIIILEGKYVSGVGGGVCQVSSTLYNALLCSNLKIIERYPHSIPAKYVDYGQDATVSYGSLDLKFQNNYDFPVYIHTKTLNNRLYVHVYGDTSKKDYNIDIRSKIIEKVTADIRKIVDKSLEPGTKIILQQGRNGYKVNTYKIFSRNGKQIKKQLISSDYYKPKDYVYKIGYTVVNNNIQKDINSNYVNDNKKAINN